MDTTHAAATIITFIIIAVIFVGIPFVIIFAIRRARKYAKTREGIPPKEQLARKAVSDVFGEGVHYEPDGSLANDLGESGLLRNFTTQEQDDHIVGQYKGIDFEQSDVRLQNWRWEQQTIQKGDEIETVDRKVWYTVFSGRWMTVKSPKTISGRVLIFNSNAYGTEQERLGKLETPYTQVELEDMAFNNVFTVLANDPHDAFYVLTPKFIERLKAVSEIKTRGKDIWLYAGFSGGTIHIGFGNVPGTFDYIRTYAKDEADAWAMAYEDLRLPVDILESLL